MTLRLAPVALALIALGCGSGSDGKDGADGAPGADGAAGAPGADGESSSFLADTESVYSKGYGCTDGYAITSTGLDDGEGDGGVANDGLLQDGEIDTTIITCLAPDVDDDGVRNTRDNCPEEPNVDQGDEDCDGIGTACETEPEGTPAVDDAASGSMYLMTHGTGWDDTPSSLYYLPDVDSEPEFIGELDHALTDIKYNPADGSLYGMEEGYAEAGKARMVLIDPVCGRSVAVTEPIAETEASVGGPYLSFGFLADGTVIGWSGFNYTFVTIDTTTAVATELGEEISPSSQPGMCVLGDDEVYFFDSYGATFLIDPTTGYQDEDTFANLGDNMKGADCNRTTGVAYATSVFNLNRLQITTSLFEDGPFEIESYVDLSEPDFNSFNAVAVVP
jgi:hypothetical protein